MFPNTTNEATYILVLFISSPDIAFFWHEYAARYVGRVQRRKWRLSLTCNEWFGAVRYVTTSGLFPLVIILHFR